MLVTLLGTIFWRLATGFAGNASFLTHLIKSLLNASGGVIDSLLSRETRRFVLLELLLFGRINGLVLGFGLLIDDRHLAINVATSAGLATFLKLLLNPFLHLNTIGFDLLLACVASLHAIGDGLLFLIFFSFVGCSNLLVDLGHFNFDIHIVIE